MFKKLFSKIVGDPNKKVIEDLQPIVDAVASFEPELEQLSDEALRERTQELRSRVTAVAEAGYPDEEAAQEAIDDALDEILPEAYALVREASRRTTSLRHYDVQIMGGALINDGHIVEMRTGEGKTLVATLPLFLNALSSKGVHLVTVNEYLARRDGGWMGNIFSFLGLTVGCIGPQQFSALYDPDYVNPGAELEDERLVHWRPCTRREAYQADITYGIASEFGFDYLRDNRVTSPEQLVQRELNFAVIDEVDNVLIDDAGTPLIISGPASKASDLYQDFSKFVRGLRRNTAEEEEEPNGHYDFDEKSRSITLTDMGTEAIERKIPDIDVDAGESLYDPRFYEMTYYLDNALKAQYVFKRDKDYAVINGEVVIIDESTGRLMHGRRYSDGLHEAIEAKEGVQIQRESITIASITIQNFFRLYTKLAGMTGTAMSDAEEFQEIYSVEVTPLPTNVQYIVDHTDAGFETKVEKIEGTEAYSYYEPNSNQPKYFKRIDFPDQVYSNQGAKDQAIIDEVARVNDTGRPILVGTTSVEHSEKIHNMLNAHKIKHNVLNAKLHQSEALTVAQAGRRGAVTISTNMAGRGTDILLGGNPEGLSAEMMETSLFDRTLLNTLATRLISDGEEAARAFAQKNSKLSPELVSWLLEVRENFDAAAAEIESVQLNGYIARIFQEEFDLDYNESLQIIQMVRGRRLNTAREYLTDRGKDTVVVDEAVRLLELHTQYQMALQDEQKMALFLAEQVFDRHYTARAALVRSVLNGHLDEARNLTAKIPALPDQLIGDVQQILANSERQRDEIWRLGGLHVIGSERHESRRIDNQLRGRAARQGDPGSSRFFLSLEDELMRRFGGERLRSFMNNNLPDDLPIENRFLDRLIESSQERIEGYNFDIRKNLLEYDDVMARQRLATYRERKEILLGEVKLEDKISDAFTLVIEELVTNYLDEYIPYLQNEIEQALATFSAEATGEINIKGVLGRLRNFLPVHRLDAEELEDLNPDQLQKRLLRLAHENEQEGRNIYQLLQAMGRFIGLVPAVPNLVGMLAALKPSARLPRRKGEEERFLKQLEEIYNGFLAEYIDPAERQSIWQDTEREVREGFEQFSVSQVGREALVSQQMFFGRKLRASMRELLVNSLSTLESDQLVEALNKHVTSERNKLRQRVGEEKYAEFTRLLVLDAIDTEWRDYLTAADDLRREIGLESAGRQRDPKVEYKKRSFEMFADMRNNIQRDIATRFFREIERREEFLRQQQMQQAQQIRLQQAGYQQVQRQQGKGIELRRDMPKVGRNDPCPCGSGKKYKQCHGRADGRTPATAVNAAAAGATPARRNTKKRRKKRR